MPTLTPLAYDSFPAGRLGVALLAFRLFVGIAFVLHGMGRIRDVPGFAAMYHLSHRLALAAKLTQIVGGVLLVVGFLTPLAGLSIAATMVKAVLFLRQKNEPFINPTGHSWEGAAFYLMAGVVIALLGPGRYSIDAVLFAGIT
ncbi:MAG: DoxX family protein [Acidobacteriota bacterium]